MIVADRPSKQARAKPHEIGAAKRSHEHLWMVENPGRYVLAETHLADIVANVEIPELVGTYVWVHLNMDSGHAIMSFGKVL